MFRLISFSVCLFLLAASPPALAGKGKEKGKRKKLHRPVHDAKPVVVVATPPKTEPPKKIYHNPASSLLNKYLNELGIDDIRTVNRTLWYRGYAYGSLKTRAGINDFGPLSEEASKRLHKLFSRQSAKILIRAFANMARTAYNNTLAVAPAGVGKSFTIPQLVALFSFGIIPDFLREGLNMTDDGTQPQPMALVKDAIIGNTDVVLINSSLLQQDPTKKGEAMADQDTRMKKVLIDITAAARAEFARSGRRTLFVIEEAGTLPTLVQETLKSITDETGLKNPEDRFEKGTDAGFSFFALTTPDELPRLIRGDSAVQRRYKEEILEEPSEAEALRIVGEYAENLWEDLYGVKVTTEALDYMVRMRHVYTSPPLAMPASVIAASDDLCIWAGLQPDLIGKPITTREAHRFIVEQTHLPDTWKEGPNGEPPFHDLERRLNELVIGQEEVVKKIAQRLKAWARGGFGREFPVFLIGGESSAGKDTLVNAVNQVLFGHQSELLKFSLSMTRGFGLNAILTGPPIGNHESERPARLVAALDGKARHGALNFNECKDADNGTLDELKMFLEEGKVRPEGQDARVRYLRLNPAFLLGQWGEELFEGKTDDEAEAIYQALSQDEIDSYFLSGNKDGQRGKVPRAVVERVRKTGLIVLLRRVPKKRYIDIVDLQLEPIIKSMTLRGINLDVSGSLRNYLVRLAAEGKSPRALGGLVVDFTETAISEANDRKLPMRNVNVRIRYAKNDKDEGTIYVEQLHSVDSHNPKKTWTFKANHLRREKICGTVL